MNNRPTKTGNMAIIQSEKNTIADSPAIKATARKFAPEPVTKPPRRY